MSALKLLRLLFGRIHDFSIEFYIQVIKVWRDLEVNHKFFVVFELQVVESLRCGQFIDVVEC